MSQPDYDRAVERIATDSAFAEAVRTNPDGALAEYELTDSERQGVLSLRSEAPAAVAASAPSALATRRSKSSIVGIGAVGAVAVAGAATFGYFHFQSFTRSLSLDAGPRQTITTVTLNNSGDIATGIGPAPGALGKSQIGITKPTDSLSPVLAQDAATGRLLNSVMIVVQKGGTDWLIEQGANCLVSSDAPSGLSSSNTPTERVTFGCASVAVSYPNGGP